MVQTLVRTYTDSSVLTVHAWRTPGSETVYFRYSGLGVWSDVESVEVNSEFTLTEAVNLLYTRENAVDSVSA